MAAVVQTGTRRGGGGLFKAFVDVDSTDVERLLDGAVKAAASPASLALFGEKVGDYLEERAANRFATATRFADPSCDGVPPPHWI